MAIKIKLKKSPQVPGIDIGALKGTPRRLAELVANHSDYEFEGFKWLQGTLGDIAQHLGVSTKTIERIVRKEPFRYLTRNPGYAGKHTLIRLGTELCESDYVDRLRVAWVVGIAYFNKAADQAWSIEVYKAKQNNLPFKRLLERAEKAKEKLPILEKLQNGEDISYEVKPHEVGLLRECVKQLGDDAFDTIACITSWDGWHKFISYAKIADRIEGRFYHWPTLHVIAANPDIALHVYLEIEQEKGQLSLPECARLNAKIAELTANMTS